MALTPTVAEIDLVLDQTSVVERVIVVDLVIEFFSATVLQSETVLEHTPVVRWHVCVSSFLA